MYRNREKIICILHLRIFAYFVVCRWISADFIVVYIYFVPSYRFVYRHPTILCIPRNFTRWINKLINKQFSSLLDFAISRAWDINAYRINAHLVGSWYANDDEVRQTESNKLEWLIWLNSYTYVCVCVYWRWLKLSNGIDLDGFSQCCFSLKGGPVYLCVCVSVFVRNVSPDDIVRCTLCDGMDTYACYECMCMYK